MTTTVLGTGTLVANGGVFNGGFSATTVSISNGAITRVLGKHFGQLQHWAEWRWHKFNQSHREQQSNWPRDLGRSAQGELKLLTL